MFSLYVERSSGLHALHPVAKVLGMVCLFVAAFLADQPRWLMPLLAGAFAVGWSAHALGLLWRLRYLFAVMIVSTAITWAFFYGEAFRFSSAGFEYGVSMGLKLATFLVCGVVFLATTKVEELAAALRSLHVPYYFGFTLTLAVRLVPVFFSAALDVRDAQRCRGLNFDRGSIGRRVRLYARLIVPVFLGALRRADRMAMALEVRGFNSGRVRTAYPRAEFGPWDTLALSLAASVAALYVWLWSIGATLLETHPR